MSTMNEKPPLTPAPEYVSAPPLPPQPTVLPMHYHGQGVSHQSATVMYVLSIVATFCCLPVCGIIGLVHAMISKHEGERGNVTAHQRRLYQAKCWTGWSIGLGLLCWILFFVWVGMAYTWYVGTYGGGDWWDYDDDMMGKHMKDDAISPRPYSTTTLDD